MTFFAVILLFLHADVDKTRQICAKVYRRFIRVHKKLLEDVKNLKLKWLQDMDPDDFWNSLYEKPKLVENETWGGDFVLIW